VIDLMSRLKKVLEILALVATIAGPFIAAGIASHWL
jgi:hypothetical protein